MFAQTSHAGLVSGRLGAGWNGQLLTTVTDRIVAVSMATNSLPMAIYRGSA